MSQELRINMAISFSKDGVDFNKSISLTVDKASAEYSAEIIAVTDTPTTIFDGIDGFAIIKNVSGDNILVKDSGVTSQTIPSGWTSIVCSVSNEAAISCGTGETATAEVIIIPATLPA